MIKHRYKDHDYYFDEDLPVFFLVCNSKCEYGRPFFLNSSGNEVRAWTKSIRYARLKDAEYQVNHLNSTRKRYEDRYQACIYVVYNHQNGNLRINSDPLSEAMISYLKYRGVS